MCTTLLFKAGHHCRLRWLPRVHAVQPSVWRALVGRAWCRVRVYISSTCNNNAGYAPSVHADASMGMLTTTVHSRHSPQPSMLSARARGTPTARGTPASGCASLAPRACACLRSAARQLLRRSPRKARVTLPPRRVWTHRSRKHKCWTLLQSTLAINDINDAQSTNRRRPGNSVPGRPCPAMPCHALSTVQRP
jgi:hypothetical protein